MDQQHTLTTWIKERKPCHTRTKTRQPTPTATSLWAMAATMGHEGLPACLAGAQHARRAWLGLSTHALIPKAFPHSSPDPPKTSACNSRKKRPTLLRSTLCYSVTLLRWPYNHLLNGSCGHASRARGTAIWSGKM